MKLPSSYILPWLPQKKIQHGPLCTAFATSYLFESYDHNYNNAPYKPFSTAFFYGIEPRKVKAFNVVLEYAIRYGGVYLKDFDNTIEDALEAVAAVNAEKERLLELAKNQKWFERIGDVSDNETGRSKMKEFILSYQLPAMVTIDLGDTYHAIACVGWDERNRLIFLDSRLRDELLVQKSFLSAFLVYPKVKPRRFPDMPEWAYDAITWSANEGIISGYEDGTFRPDNPVTWGEALKMVLLFAGYSEQKGTEHWADGYAKLAYNEDFLNELPIWLDDPITREEVVELIGRANHIDPLFTSPFKDTDNAYVSALYNAEIINGYPDGTFKPDQDLTRAELVTILYRIGADNA